MIDDATEGLTRSCRRLALAAALCAVLFACQGKDHGAAGKAIAQIAADAKHPAFVDTDSLDVVLPRIATRLAPYLSAMDSFASVLRADSGTVRADSLFWRFRESRDRAVNAAFDGPPPIDSRHNVGFQNLIASDALEAVEYHQPGAPPLPAFTHHDSVADSVTRFMNAHGVWTRQAEGETDFAANDATLLAVLGPFVTEATRDAMRMEERLQRHPIGGDAAISISWDDLGDLVAETDQFLATYPIGPAHDLVAKWNASFLGDYLAGWPNTPTFDGQSHMVDSAHRASYERYGARHNSLPSSRVVRQYLDLLEASGYHPNSTIKAFVKAHGAVTVPPDSR